VAISAYFNDLGMIKYSKMVFTSAIIMFSAVIFELVDVAIDHFLKNVSSFNNSNVIIMGSFLEYIIAVSAIILALISLEKLRTTLRFLITEVVKE
tara:strand:- start:182 stop:466 length:285 start_codon:yes stop_codon:yes gene_type:complete